MSIDLQQTQYISDLSGFRKKFGYTVTSPFSGVTLGVGQFVSITTNLLFTNPGLVIGDISAVRIKYDGLDTFWRTLDGFVFAEYPSSAAPQYEVSAITYFTKTQHTVYVYIVNETPGSLAIPAFDIVYKLETYDSLIR